jgi:hypothetical protein
MAPLPMRKPRLVSADGRALSKSEASKSNGTWTMYGGSVTAGIELPSPLNWHNATMRRRYPACATATHVPHIQ